MYKKFKSSVNISSILLTVLENREIITLPYVGYSIFVKNLKKFCYFTYYFIKNQFFSFYFLQANELITLIKPESFDNQLTPGKANSLT